MLDACIIKLAKESKWISLIVVQDKNTTGEVWICVDLRKLNDAFCMTRFLLHLQMRYWRVSWVKKFTHSLMGSLDAIRLESQRKIDTRKPLRRSGVVSNTR